MVRWLAAATVGGWLALAAAPAWADRDPPAAARRPDRDPPTAARTDHAEPAARRADRDPPVPAGSRADGDRHVSALGFRATADWYEKLWRRRGLVVRTVGPYRVGGVDVIRYLRDDGPWRAVHIYRIAGKTWISVVAAAADPSPAAAPSRSDGSTPAPAADPIAPASGSAPRPLDEPRATE